MVNIPRRLSKTLKEVLPCKELRMHVPLMMMMVMAWVERLQHPILTVILYFNK